MNEKIKTLKIIHLGICSGIILAYFFIGHFSIEELKNYSLDSDQLVYIAIPIVAFILSSYLFKNQLKQINSNLTLEEKMPSYQSASIVRWAILEGAAFAILFLVPGMPIFGIFLILYLAFLSPTEDKINYDLNSIQ